MFDLQPYVLLPLQIAGILLAAGIVRRWLPGAGPAVTTAVVATALLGAMLGPQLWKSLVALRDARASLAVQEGVGDFGRCFPDGSNPDLLPFTRWLRERIPDGEPFSLDGIVDYACFQLNVLPHVILSPDEPTRWRVHIGAPPEAFVDTTGGRQVFRYDDEKTLTREP